MDERLLQFEKEAAIIKCPKKLTKEAHGHATEKFCQWSASQNRKK
jgi:hypothetical protein